MTQRDENKRSVDGNLGISRRDLLRRGAVVGGTVLWVTPVIQSMSRPAFAQATPREGCFAIKWSREDGCEDAQPLPGGGTVFCISPPADVQAGGCQGVTFDDSQPAWTATLPPGCTLVPGQGCSKCGSGEGQCGCGATQSGNVVTFPATCPNGADISHIELVYCCE